MYEICSKWTITIPEHVIDITTLFVNSEEISDIFQMSPFLILDNYWVTVERSSYSDCDQPFVEPLKYKESVSESVLLKEKY